MARGKKEQIVEEELVAIQEEEPKEELVEAQEEVEAPTHEAVCIEYLLYNGVDYAPGDLVEIENEEIYNRLLHSNVIE